MSIKSKISGVIRSARQACQILIVLLTLSFLIPRGECYSVFANKNLSTKGTITAAESPRRATVNNVPTKNPATWKFANEHEWIVDSIGRDIAEILAFAMYLDGSTSKFTSKDIVFQTKTIDREAGQYLFELQLRNSKLYIERNFSLVDHAWSPENYAPFAKQLIKNLGLSRPTYADTSQDFLSTLASADMESLIGENKRISMELSLKPLDAGLHEQAALLHATFALLELAGGFSDTRPSLSRISTHISLAKALNNDRLGTTGSIANAALESLSCRDGAAVTLIAEMEKNAFSAPERSWLRALKIRSTGDYRIFDENEHSQLEEIQYGMWFWYFNSDKKTMEYVEEHFPICPLQWMKIVVANGRFSAATREYIIPRLVNYEISAFTENCKNYFYDRYSRDIRQFEFHMIADDLNLSPARCLTDEVGASKLTVLAWNDLAAFHARHLLNAISIQYGLYQDSVVTMHGQKPEEKWSTFSHLPLYPFALNKLRLAPKEKEENLLKVQQILLSHPELVTSKNWRCFSLRVKSDTQHTALVSPENWFAPAMPMGTLFSFRDRRELKTFSGDLAALTELKNANPENAYLCRDWAIKKYGAHPTSEQYEEAFGKRLEFDVNAMKITALGAVNSPDKFVYLEEKVARIQPDAYFALGAYCVANNRVKQAAQFFETGLTFCENSEVVSNNSDWLINYRYDHGQWEKARELAEFAGYEQDYYGLDALARFYERENNLSSAEQTYRKILSRYQTRGEWTAFLVRNASKDERYKAEAELALKSIFPNGMKKVIHSDLKEAPRHGLLVHEVDMIKLPPLKSGMVIVAMNGFLVENKTQYDVARNMTSAKYLNMIFWDGKCYKTTRKRSLGNNLLGVDVRDFDSRN